MRMAGFAMAASITLATAASGQVFKYNFILDGSQEVPPVATPGSGTARVVFNSSNNELKWDISWSGLLGATTGMHFHGPAMPGVNAGVQIDIGAISGLVSPSIGSTTLTPTQATDLLAGLYYVNIHSTMHPAGEIRGQVVPSPAAGSLLALGGLAALRRRRIAPTGTTISPTLEPARS